jgi:hypothetical protein
VTAAEVRFRAAVLEGSELGQENLRSSSSAAVLPETTWAVV